ncbi:MAG TPA: VirB8/TrbF family protein [Desulfobacterales bacterium]|nr:VirB8/TrbF family protein [Desulfobacterales bacterium]
MATVIIAESLFLLTLLGKVSEVKPMPIFVDREAGTARVVDFSVIDAEGQKRVDSEIHDFVKDYVSNIYTFTKFTIESNLRRVLDQTSDEAQNMVKNVIYSSKRSESLTGGYQGICDINSISILEASSTIIRVQVVFIRKLISSQNEVSNQSKAVAAITLKVVLRQKNNAHGLYVVEYRESEIKE